MVEFFFRRYKTKLCRNFGDNLKCNFEDKCKYAHGQAELRDELSNLRYMPKPWPKPCLKYLASGYCYFGFRCKFLHGEIKEKTELCRYFEKNSKCRYGDKCRFAHGQNEYYFHNAVNNSSYKTRPCQKYNSDVGYCKYGSKCAFLHGEIKEKNKELYNKYPHLSKLKF